MSQDLDNLRAAIRETIEEAFEQRTRIDAETHAAHHAVIADWLECRKRRREALDRAFQQVLGWGIVAAVGGLGTLLWRIFKHEVQR